MRTIFFKKIENTTEISAQTIWSPTDTQLSENDEILKYKFFNHLTVYNNSSVDIEIRLHGENNSDVGVEYVPAGATIIFDTEDNIRYTRPAIYNRNASVAIAANEIIMMVRRVE